MVKCGNCAAFNYDEARFCVHCGARITPPGQLPSRKATEGGAIPAAPSGTRKTAAGQAASFGAAATPSRKLREPSGQALARTVPEPVAPSAPATMTEALAKAAHPGKASTGAPVAPAANRAPPPAASDDTAALPPSERLPFGDLLDDLDQRFRNLTAAATSGSGPGQPVGIPGEVRTLFAQIAATHMGPVRDFMLECRLGEPAREWLDVVIPAVRSLGKSAKECGLPELRDALDSYLEALDAARPGDGISLGSEVREKLAGAYAGLAATMPDAFALDQERDRREPIIVQSLLRRVPEVRKVTLDRLYSAGLTSLTMYYAAKPQDIVEAAGIASDLAARVVSVFREYKMAQSRLGPEAQRAEQRRQIETLTAKLKQLNWAFDTAARGWSPADQANKRRIREERSAVVLDLQLVLARAGAVDLVQQLERLPFQRKCAELTRYLEKTGASPREQ